MLEKKSSKKKWWHERGIKDAYIERNEEINREINSRKLSSKCTRGRREEEEKSKVTKKSAEVVLRKYKLSKKNEWFDEGQRKHPYGEEWINGKWRNLKKRKPYMQMRKKRNGRSKKIRN